jgi:hypothetical protein
MAEPEAVVHADEIKRTTGPQTTNGKRWEVQLSAIPSRQWLDLFKLSSDASKTAMPQRVEFDRGCAVFKSDEDHVEHWIASIDKWIASTNARHRLRLEHARRELSDRLDAETKEKGRIQGLNDRFKNL